MFWEGYGYGMERREGYTICYGRKIDRVWWIMCVYVCIRIFGKGERGECRLLVFSFGRMVLLCIVFGEDCRRIRVFWGRSYYGL